MSTYTEFKDAIAARGALQPELYSLMAKQQGKEQFSPAHQQAIYNFSLSPSLKKGITALREAAEDRDRPADFDWTVRHHIEWLIVALLASYDLPFEVGKLKTEFFDACCDLSQITAHQPTKELAWAIMGSPAQSWTLITLHPDSELSQTKA